MKVLILHDWLLGMRGGERVLEVICSLLPRADLMTLFLDANSISSELSRRTVEVSLLNRLPAVRRYYRHLLPLYPWAVRQLSRRVSTLCREHRYDAVISVSHCAAKNVVVPPDIPHFCYCLTPMRYIWDQYDAYFGGRHLEPVIRHVAGRLRRWDVDGAGGIRSFAAISEFVAGRIRRCYGREAEVIYPPVPTEWISPAEGPGNGFLSVGALVPYKNVNVIVEAFNHLGLPLTIVGHGPEEKALRRMASSNITFRRDLTAGELAKLYRESKALVFAAEEDFGLVPVEAMAAGRPIIALAQGGVLETAKLSGDCVTGVPFDEPRAEAVIRAVHSFLDRESVFTVEECVKRATVFNVRRFQQAFERFIDLRRAVPQQIATC